MSDEAVTNAELARQIQQFRSDNHEDLRRIETLLSQMVRKDLYDANRAADLARVAALEEAKKRAEDDRKTLIRLVVTAVIVPVLLFFGSLWQDLRGSP